MLGMCPSRRYRFPPSVFSWLISPQLSANVEISSLMKIIGLKTREKYTDTKSLRYGHVMIMTDQVGCLISFLASQLTQDHDGSHIKGLLINFFHKFWPSLLKIDGFMVEFITPIVKVGSTETPEMTSVQCTKGTRVIPFYTIPEYQQWKEETDGGKRWKIKYYKVRKDNEYAFSYRDRVSEQALPKTPNNISPISTHTR